MNIIFNDSLNDIPNSFTVLELDTFNLVNEGRTSTAYCIVEKIPLAEFDKIDAYKKVHSLVSRKGTGRDQSNVETDGRVKT